MGGTFHFVCHDCAEEGVYGDRTVAVTARDDHVNQTNHRVSMIDIATPQRVNR